MAEKKWAVILAIESLFKKKGVDEAKTSVEDLAKSEAKAATSAVAAESQVAKLSRAFSSASSAAKVFSHSLTTSGSELESLRLKAQAFRNSGGLFGSHSDVTAYNDALRANNEETERLAKTGAEASRSVDGNTKSLREQKTVLADLRSTLGLVSITLTTAFAAGAAVAKAAGEDLNETVSVGKSLWKELATTINDFVGGPFRALGDAISSGGAAWERYSESANKAGARFVSMGEAAKRYKEAGGLLTGDKSADLSAVGSYQAKLQSFINTLDETTRKELEAANALAARIELEKNAGLRTESDYIAALRAKVKILEVVIQTSKDSKAFEEERFRTLATIRNSETAGQAKQHQQEGELEESRKEASKDRIEREKEEAKVVADSARQRVETLWKAHLHELRVDALIEKSKADAAAAEKRRREEATTTWQNTLSQALRWAQQVAESAERAAIDATEKMIAGIQLWAGRVSGIIGQLSALQDARTNTRLATLEREKNAEIEAAKAKGKATGDIEKKYAAQADALKRKAFERNKQYQRAQTLVNTAAAVVVELVRNSWWGAAAAAIAGALQLQTINAQKYQGSFAKGTDRLARGGIAEVHAGEAIVPAEPAEKFRRVADFLGGLSASAMARGAGSMGSGVSLGGSVASPAGGPSVVSIANPEALGGGTSIGEQVGSKLVISNSTIIAQDAPSFQRMVVRGGDAFRRNVETRNTRG
jgi:hypothetical protein